MKLIMIFLGFIIGSFLNVCIYRIPKEQSIIYPPSTCGSCSNQLKPIDLVPILSYLFLKGKCRRCGAKIALRYPLIELLTGLVFLLIYTRIGLQTVLLKYLFLSSILIVISFIDIEYQIIPDKIVVFAMVMGMILNIFIKDVSFFSSLMGLVLGGGILLLIALVTNGAMGGGDIKLMAVLGYYLGWQATVMALLLSFILGGVIGVLLLLLKLKTRKDAVPFGPFLALGGLIATLYYYEIFYFYLTTLV